MRTPVTLSLRGKFSAMLALFALLPSMALCILLVQSSESQFVSSGVRNAVAGIDQAVSSLQYTIQAVENTAATLSQDQALQKAHNDLADQIPLDQAIDTYRTLDRMLRYFQVNNDFSIRLYLPDYDRITSQEWSIYGISALSEDAQIPELVKNDSLNAAWTEFYELEKGPGQGLAATYCHTLFSYSRYSPKNSMICIDLSASVFLQAFQNAGQPDAVFFLTSQDGRLLLCSDEEAEENILTSFAAANPPSDSLSELFSVEGYGECHYQRSSLGSGGWKIHALVPVRQFRREGLSIVWYYLLFLALTAAGILATAHFVADGLVRELRDLTALCIRVRDGDYQPVPGCSSTREIRVLQDTFHDMVRRIDTLINDVYRERLAKQETRVAFLYEQMKPHFLYNTLESAKWMAIRGGAPDVAKFLETLSRFFRLTLSKGAEWVTIRQEVELARAYVGIMNARFNDGISFVEDAVPSLQAEPVMRLILQPFIENAVIHGIYEKPDRRGTIRLNAVLRDDSIQFSISDDGMGMDEDSFDRLNSREKLGFGIANVRDRLALYYKDQFTITFLRNETGGTTVHITVPRMARSCLQPPAAG